jgi:hypothetical protein
VAEKVALLLLVAENDRGPLQPLECDISFPHTPLVVDFYRATIFIPTLQIE